MGPCSLGPMMIVYPEGVFYCKLIPENVDDIVEKHLYQGTPVEEFFYRIHIPARQWLLFMKFLFYQAEKIALETLEPLIH